MAKRKKVDYDMDEQLVANDLKKSDEVVFKKYVHPTALFNIKLTPIQKDIIKSLDDCIIGIISGVAGTSKTFLSCYYAIKLLKENKIKKIILTKPIEESGERLGFLPGTVEEKVAPYMESYKNNFLKLIPQTTYDKLIRDNVIEFKALAYMRGINLDDACVLADEFQNSDLRQFMLLVTRIGKDSKLIISGDVGQSDIEKKYTAFTYFCNMVKGIEGIYEYKFPDDHNMRNPIITEITKRYEEAKYTDKSIPLNKR